MKKLIKLWFGFLTAAMVGAAVAKRRLPVTDGITDDEISLVSIFDGVEYMSRAAAFTGGRIVTAFGGTRVDLSSAIAAGVPAHLQILTAFGGLDLIVPIDWEVESDGKGFMAGIQMLKPLDDPAAPLLTIESFTLFGGFRVRRPS